MNNDVFVVTGISEGEKVRLTRIAKGLRQIDLASLAKVNVCDITALEKDRYLPRSRKRKIIAVLGIDEEREIKNSRRGEGGEGEIDEK